MANPFDDAILEGFICPKCMLTFGTPELLSRHFTREHSTHKALVNNEVFQNSADGALGTIISSHAFYENRPEKQLPGNDRSLTDEFEVLRKKFVNKSSLETNNLLIRLEKLVTAPLMSDSERKAFEQTVVPWIDAKVELCPSCGKSFGLGSEIAYPEEFNSNGNIGLETEKSKSLMWIGKHVNRLTSTILDYNPVYRRRHHCRLCGHVLCADCSHFLLLSNAQKLLCFLNARNVELFSFDAGSVECSNEYNSVDNEFNLFTDKDDMETMEKQKGEYQLRVCLICKSILERKLNRRRLACGNSFILQMHAELKHFMCYVTTSLPTYTTIAESLNCGEERYALELARSMHSELLQALQKIELIGRRFEKIVEFAPESVLKNRPLIRVGIAVSRQARSFVQIHLPPLRTLPTMRQYGDLAAQRKDELASRWQEEDKALAQLTHRMANQSEKSSQHGQRIWHKLFQSPTQSTENIATLPTHRPNVDTK